MIKAEAFLAEIVSILTLNIKENGEEMKKLRTGLLLESLEAAKTARAAHTAKAEIVKHGACTVTKVKVDNDDDARLFEREKGTYITVETDRVYQITDSDFESIVAVIADIMQTLMPKKRGRILIAGIGNRAITADSLGPKCVDRIIVTRGFEKVMPEVISDGTYSSVSAICSNVFGVTGIESAELIGGISAMIEPSLIIIVDALATASVSRLCRTIQISDTSLTPGGGVDNARQKISPDNLDTPVLSIGMPTVIDVSAIMSAAGCSEKEIEKQLGQYGDSMIATPTRIDSATDIAAKLIAFSINKALHSDMNTEDILRFLY